MARSSKPRRARPRTRTFPFDAAEVLDTPEAIAEYLTAALETNDPSYIAKAIGTVARARGMSDIARESGLSRENLYRSLNGETKTELDTIVRVLNALGIQLSAVPKPAA
jgi:probable addiction module antidote protein